MTEAQLIHEGWALWRVPAACITRYGHGEFPMYTVHAADSHQCS